VEITVFDEVLTARQEELLAVVVGLLEADNTAKFAISEFL